MEFGWLKMIKVPEHRLAWLIAMDVDALQIIALPLFAPGGAFPG
jgi:hypothetical protein